MLIDTGIWPFDAKGYEHLPTQVDADRDRHMLFDDHKCNTHICLRVMGKT